LVNVKLILEVFTYEAASVNTELSQNLNIMKTIKFSGQYKLLMQAEDCSRVLCFKHDSILKSHTL